MVATLVLYIVGGSYRFYDSSASSSCFYFACLREGLESFSLGPKAFVKAKDLIQRKSRILSAADMWLLGAIISHAIKEKTTYYFIYGPSYNDRIDMDRGTFH